MAADSISAGVPGDPVRLFGPDMLADPWAAYARLRALDPVHWSAPLGAWVLTGYDEVVAVLRSPSFSSTLPVPDRGVATGAQREVLASTYRFVHSSLVFSDPPAHTRLRRLVGRAFVPGVVEQLADTFEAVARRLLAAPPTDLVHELADPLPMAVLGELLGVTLTEEEQHRLKTDCDDFLLPFGRDVADLDADAVARAQKAGADLDAFVSTVLDRHDREQDVVARLLAGEADDRLSRAELFANIVLFLVAGHENATSLISNGALLLFDRPDVRALAAADPDRWPGVVDELLRLVTPNQFVRRQATEDVEVGARTVRAGDPVLLVLAAANRDPARFPDPDTLVLDRAERRDVVFGQGPHHCLGAPLARLEAVIAFRTLFETWPSLRRAAGPPEPVDNFNVRLLRRLPVRAG